MILDRGKSGSWGHFVSHAKQILPILICKMFWHASFGLQPLQLFFTCIVCLLFLWLQQNLIQAVSNISWLLSLTTGNNKGLTLALQSFIITACWREISVNIPQLFSMSRLLFQCAKTSLIQLNHFLSILALQDKSKDIHK